MITVLEYLIDGFGYIWRVNAANGRVSVWLPTQCRWSEESTREFTEGMDIENGGTPWTTYDGPAPDADQIEMDSMREHLALVGAWAAYMHWLHQTLAKRARGGYIVTNGQIIRDNSYKGLCPLAGLSKHIAS